MLLLCVLQYIQCTIVLYILLLKDVAKKINLKFLSLSTLNSLQQIIPKKNQNIPCTGIQTVPEKINCIMIFPEISYVISALFISS